MRNDPKIRAVVAARSSHMEGPVTDEEVLALVRMPEAKSLQLMGHLINELYLETETSEIPNWFTGIIKEITCPHPDGELLSVTAHNYLTDGDTGHIAMVMCRDNHSIPVIGLTSTKPAKVSSQIDEAIELWRRAYDSHLTCPSCDAANFGRSRLKELVKQRLALVKTKCLDCQEEAFSGLIWHYQDPLRQGPPPSSDEVILTHETLRKVSTVADLFR